jgi:hypothetical protein
MKAAFLSVLWSRIASGGSTDASSSMAVDTDALFACDSSKKRASRIARQGSNSLMGGLFLRKYVVPRS